MNKILNFNDRQLFDNPTIPKTDLSVRSRHRTYEAVHNLRHALHMHHGRWSPEEILRVRDLLNNTAKAIVDGPAVQPAPEKAE